MLSKRLPSSDSTSRPSITCGTNFMVANLPVSFSNRCSSESWIVREPLPARRSGNLGLGRRRGAPLSDGDAALRPVARRHLADYHPDRLARDAKGGLDRRGHRLVERANLLRG